MERAAGWSPRIGALRRRGGRFTLLFHDTHHRAVSDPDAITALRSRRLRRRARLRRSAGRGLSPLGLGRPRLRLARSRRHPPVPPAAHANLAERPRLDRQLGRRRAQRRAARHSCSSRPQRLGLPLDIYGVRYPDARARRARGTTARRYRGWLPNAEVPDVFAAHLATVHVPAPPLCRALPGIPTIRVFEALACGIPLVSRALARHRGSVPARRGLPGRARRAPRWSGTSRRSATIRTCAARWSRAAWRRSACAAHLRAPRRRAARHPSETSEPRHAD